MDCKSSDVVDDKSGRVKKHQARTIGTFVRDHLKGPINVHINKKHQKGSSVLKARFAYIYVSTHKKGKSTYVECIDDAGEKIEDFPVITMKALYTKKFLGPVFEVHDSIRALCEPNKIGLTSYST